MGTQIVTLEEALQFVRGQFTRLQDPYNHQFTKGQYEIAQQYFLNLAGRIEIIDLVVTVSNYVQRNVIADAIEAEPVQVNA